MRFFGSNGLVALSVAVALSTAPLSAASQGFPLELSVKDAPGSEITLTMEDLDAMEQSAFVTTTIWTYGEVSFSGVPLADVLALSETEATEVELIALNDYMVSIPIEAVEETAPLLATRMNGEEMSVRDKGPFWIVFPYDSDPRYQTETVFSQSVWQLNRIAIIE